MILICDARIHIYNQKDDTKENKTKLPLEGNDSNRQFELQIVAQQGCNHNPCSLHQQHWMNEIPTAHLRICE